MRKESSFSRSESDRSLSSIAISVTQLKPKNPRAACCWTQEQRSAKGAIDRYILAGIEAKGLQPAADAAPQVLLRRLSFDLIGLPPTPEELDAFLADTSPAGIDKLIDRLLQSRQFGPYWARDWLDGVRFNDSIETMDHYRQWVVGAFNNDMPYDRFIRAQIAGDLLPAKDFREKDANRIAEQMLYLNIKEMDPIEGIGEVLGQQFLGVSINCAKCHDHMYDAYSQKDYYALAGIFTSTSMAKKKSAEMRVALAGTPTAILTVSEGVVGDTNLLLKGDSKQPGESVSRRFPMVLAGDQQKPLSQVTKQSGRLELANWIADANNPLTARVMVNRVWQRLMGCGLVASQNDFGTQGDAPTHPELLDHLADRFVKSGWSIKALIREIVASRTYQQASRASKEIVAADLENKLWTRASFRRLTFEQIHDTLYCVAGRLDLNPPPVYLTKKDGLKKYARPNIRAIYQRDLRAAKVFDGADPELLVEKREASVTAPQMLFFLNSKEVIELAGAVAQRAERSTKGTDMSAKVVAAYRVLFGRTPTEAEMSHAKTFLTRQNFARSCHALLCTSEFVYLD